ncbi:CHORD domain-containing protein 1 [Intoshia linei]|uniref:CHORD domain-containing protein 1 n=1 Tax=Intoshia linei TaxID=1819745 RepID=A0A177BEI2_9BILA|nr:CHORD domain-containing protein 1 [Intoshia linei]
MQDILYCYNYGCNKKYKADDTDTCFYHKSPPTFHDALKIWPCCSKKSVGFDEFLAIPGCISGNHSNIRPFTENKSKSIKTEIEKELDVVHEPVTQIDRPDINEVLSCLKFEESEELIKKAGTNRKECSNDLENKDISCCNNSCSMRKSKLNDDSLICVYHPGHQVFHEGLKFWSCCEKKTTKFDIFIHQKGCFEGEHNWEKKLIQKECKMDWSNSTKDVVIALYSKMPVVPLCTIKANRIKICIDLVYENGKSILKKELELYESIDPILSYVRYSHMKTEIILCKEIPKPWDKLTVS